MTAQVPPGWPSGVHPPGTPRFEETAVAWLLELVPPEYRRYGVLRRHPVLLARTARHHVTAAVEAARQGFRTARADLSGVVPGHAIEAMLDLYRREGARLVSIAEAVDLVDDALRGGLRPPGTGGSAAPRADGPAPSHPDGPAPSRTDAPPSPRAGAPAPPRTEGSATSRTGGSAPPRTNDLAPPRTNDLAPPRTDGPAPPRADGPATPRTGGSAAPGAGGRERARRSGR